MALLLIVSLAAVWFMALRNREPIYQGRRVSAWIRIFACIESAQVTGWMTSAPGGNVRIFPPSLLPPNANANVAFSTAPAGGGSPRALVGRTTGLNSQIVTHVFTMNGSSIATNMVMYVGNNNLNSLNPLNVFKEIGADAVPFLVRALKHKDSFATAKYLRIHAALPPSVARVLPAPLPASALRRAAAKALDALGSTAKPAIPALVEALHDPDPIVKQYVLTVLRKLVRTQAEAEAMVQVAFRPDLPNVQAVYLARDLGARGPKVIEALSRAVRDQNVTLRREAMGLLKHMRQAAESAVPVFVQALSDSDHDVRYLAVWALEEVGPAARSAIPDLEKALHDEGPMIRSAATRALKKLRNEADEK